MSNPRFAVGQNVAVAPSKQYRPPKGQYRVVGAMPEGDGRFRYRIKGDLESYERVIDELYLSEV
jgi:hypothetical protein